MATMAWGPDGQQPAVPGQAGCKLFFALHPVLSPARWDLSERCRYRRRREEGRGQGLAAVEQSARAVSGTAAVSWPTSCQVSSGEN